ncbi:MAG: AMP-binding protein [Rhodocyclales bacterium]|nr:AMP-binding protein [Rhodocyclales bacterium]
MNAPSPEHLAANPLDAAAAALIGAPAGPLRLADLRRHQFERLRETVAWAQQKSPFYRRLLAGIDAQSLRTADDLCRLPFTTADDLRRNDPPLVCVSQDEVSHVVTLETSGTQGPAKRLYFLPGDQVATRDFFVHGMSVFTRPGDRVAILFPGGRAGSVGDLLAHALRGFGAEPLVADWPQDPAATARAMREFRPDVVAGAPVAVLAVARHDAAGKHEPLRVRSALLSSDRAGASLRAALTGLWGCEVYDHYGMTEMGLGGGVDCPVHAGYHMREAELLFEVVDPATGAPVPEGAVGEVVVTTLTRRGLPLIRYRTGDLSRIVPGACACNSPLLRLDRIAGRLGAGVDLGTGELSMAMLDEALFALPKVIDFAATCRLGKAPRLHVDIATLPGGGRLDALRTALTGIPVLAQAIARRRLHLSIAVAADGRLRTRVGKRRIAVDNAA